MKKRFLRWDLLKKQPLWGNFEEGHGFNQGSAQLSARIKNTL